MAIQLSRSLQKDIARFLEKNPPQAISTYLRQMTIVYIKNEMEAGNPMEFYGLLSTLGDLFHLLDKIVQETEAPAQTAGLTGFKTNKKSSNPGMEKNVAA